MENKILSIAVVNWNTREMTKNCIESILKNTMNIDYEIIIVDNGSIDGSVEAIEENFPQVILIKNSENLGYAQPNNQALEISRGKYFLLLNSDTIVHGNALEQMVNFLDTHPEAGAATCKLLNADGSIQYGMHRRFPTFLGLNSAALCKRYPRFTRRWVKELYMLDNEFNELQKIEQAAGACIMIRRETLDFIGGLFDADNFPLLFNDVDLCYRLYQKGLALYLVPTAQITHLKSQSINKLAISTHIREHVVSSLRFFKKHRKYKDYLLSKIAYSLFFSCIVPYHATMLLIRKTDLNYFRNWLSVPLSALLDKKISV